MMYLYTGTPGSGKSLHIAKVIYDSLQQGLPCIANFDIKIDMIPKVKGEFVYIDMDKLTPGYLVGYSREYFSKHKFKEGLITVFIDEAQLWFNARDYQKKDRMEWLKFFTNHRKFGFDIILVAQYEKMLDKQILSLFEYQEIHRKVSNFGTKGKFISLLCGGKLFCCVKIWYPVKQNVGSQFFKMHKKYYEIYNSYSDFTDIVAPDQEVVKGKSVKNHVKDTQSISDIVKSCVPDVSPL